MRSGKVMHRSSVGGGVLAPSFGVRPRSERVLASCWWWPPRQAGGPGAAAGTRLGGGEREAAREEFGPGSWLAPAAAKSSSCLCGAAGNQQRGPMRRSDAAERTPAAALAPRRSRGGAAASPSYCCSGLLLRQPPRRHLLRPLQRLVSPDEPGGVHEHAPGDPRKPGQGVVPHPAPRLRELREERRRPGRQRSGTAESEGRNWARVRRKGDCGARESGPRARGAPPCGSRSSSGTQGPPARACGRHSAAAYVTRGATLERRTSKRRGAQRVALMPVACFAFCGGARTTARPGQSRGST